MDNLFSPNASIIATPNLSLSNSQDQRQQQRANFVNNTNRGTGFVESDSVNFENMAKFHHPRSSPSFNDSAPPSYFEAIGLSHNHVSLNTGGNHNHHHPHPHQQNFVIDSNNTSRFSSIQLQQQQQQQQHHQQNPSKMNTNNNNKNFRKNSTVSNTTSKDFSSIQLTPQSFSLNQNGDQAQHNRIVRTNNHIPSLYQPSLNGCYDVSVNNTINNNSINLMSQKPSETYMVWSIFTTFYCVFIGLAALVLSIKVHHYNKQGDYQKAFSRSKIARNLNIAGLFFGFIYLGVGLLACFIPRG